VRAFHGVHGIQSNVEIVRTLFERFAEGGVDATLAGFSDDLVIEVPPELSAEPDTYQGHDGVRRYFAGFEGMIENVRYEPVELVPVGDRVIAHIRLSGRGESSGVDVELEAFVLHELEDGKITRMRPYPDMDSARAAAEAA
jgi:ketosteroid isomerase-like protein